MKMPNFLIVGAAKSGTTALYHYLRQHPQVYMSAHKETNFFAFEDGDVTFSGPGDEVFCQSTVTSLADYERQFEAATDEIAVGEASPWYLYSERAAANIRRHLPQTRLIVVLRDPVDRAFSSYLHVIRDGRESLTFEEGLLAEEDRIAQGWEFIWHYKRAGCYVSQVERFLRHFPRDQIRFFLYDDLLADPAGFFASVCGFLGVNVGFTTDTSLRHNATGVPKNRLLGRLVLEQNTFKSAVKMLTPDQLRYRVGQRIKQRLLQKPTLNLATHRELSEAYSAEILALQDLIHRDLSPWLPSF